MQQTRPPRLENTVCQVPPDLVVSQLNGHLYEGVRTNLTLLNVSLPKVPVLENVKVYIVNLFTGKTESCLNTRHSLGWGKEKKQHHKIEVFYHRERGGREGEGGGGEGERERERELTGSGISHLSLCGFGSGPLTVPLQCPLGR